MKQKEKMKFSSPVTDEVEDQRRLVPQTFIDGFEKKQDSWFAISQVPTDLSIQVQDITFYVHKYPLVSKCGYFNRIELQPPESETCTNLKLDNFPGGSETFEIILKFCYGISISLVVSNVAALRCGSEFLEMTEALEDGNLISKAEAFITFVVLSSWTDSITVLKSCETLSPWAENLQIVRRCCDAIGWKIFKEASTIGGIVNGETWWCDDVSTLRIDYFTRIVTVLKAKGMKSEIIGSCIAQYAEKWLPNAEPEGEGGSRNNYGKYEMQWSITSGKKYEEIGPTREQRLIVESLLSLLPPGKDAVSCKFLLKMLKMALLYSASPALISELEKRVGLVLEGADVNDLLIPSAASIDQGKQPLNPTEEQTMHNIEVVQRILEYFLLYEQQQLQQQAGPLAISKLLDNYLAEIARDPNLTVMKFQFLAQSLPENARTSDDGLYRAIDTYLKTHPTLSDHERRRLCKVLNCGKLSQDACAHAAQNERLPLRTIIQVLFSEQVKMRAGIQRNSQIATADKSDQETSPSSTNKEVRYLRIELEKVKDEMAEMQRKYSEVQQVYQKQNVKQRKSSGWTVGWQKLRKSALFNLKTYEEDTDQSHNRPEARTRSLLRRQTVS